MLNKKIFIIYPLIIVLLFGVLVGCSKESTVPSTGINAGMQENGYFVNLDKYDYTIKECYTENITLDQCIEALIQYFHTEDVTVERYCQEYVASIIFTYADRANLQKPENIYSDDLDSFTSDQNIMAILEFYNQDTYSNIQSAEEFRIAAKRRMVSQNILNIQTQILRNTVDNPPEEYVNYIKEFNKGVYQQYLDENKDTNPNDIYSYRDFLFTISGGNTLSEEEFYVFAAKAKFAIMKLAKSQGWDPLLDEFTANEIESMRNGDNLCQNSYNVLRQRVFDKFVPIPKEILYGD